MTQLMPTQSIYIQNDSGQDIPPRSIVVVTSVEITEETDLNESIAVYHVMQYSAGFGNILVTGIQTIKSGTVGLSPPGWSASKSFGRGFYDEVIYVSIDPSVADPVVGEMWGPVPGAWTITRGGMGFICFGYTSTGDAIKRAVFKREQPRFLVGKSTSSIPTGSLSTPTSFNANIWLPTGSSASTGYAVATQAGFLGITVYNYDSSLGNSSTGIYCEIEPYGQRWKLKWVGCSP